MIFAKKLLGELSLLCLIVVLFGQLTFQFLNYHFHLIAITAPLILIVFVNTISLNLIKLKALNFDKGDFLFLYFITYLVASFTFVGESNVPEFLIRIFLVIIGPYVVGRTLTCYLSHSGSKFYLTVYFFSLCVLAYEILQDSSIISTGRFVLYDLNDEFGSGNATQAFVTSIFGSAVIFMFSIRSSKKYSFTRNFVLILSIIIVVIFGSRSSTIAVTLTLIIVYLIRNGPTVVTTYIKLFLGIILGFGLLLLMIPNTRLEFFNEVFRGEGSTDIRALLFLDAWSLFLESPLFGIGASNFGHFYNFIISDYASPHSFFLHILTELGILGMLIFISLIMYIFYKMYSMYKYAVQFQNPYLFPFFTYWMFLLFDMQSYGNYFYDYHWFVITGVLVSMFRR
jgi:O-antigen ligase